MRISLAHSFILVTGIIFSVSCQHRGIMNADDLKNQSAPRAKKIDHILTSNNNDQRHDPYFWLRDRQNPQVIDYLKAENAYTQAQMQHTEALQKKLFSELKNRIKETDESVPVKDGDYYYYTRTEAGKQYTIYCRRHDSMQAKEEILLDLNALAGPGITLNVGGFEASPDHRYIAYALSTDGSDAHTIHILDTQTNKLLPDQIHNNYGGLEWGNDSRTIYYIQHDATFRPSRALRHRLGELDATKDELLLEEKDERFYLGVAKARDDRFIYIESESKLTTEVTLLDASDARSRPRVFAPRRENIKYSIDHREDEIYILTNDGKDAKNYRILRTSDQKWDRANWQEVIPAYHDAKITYIDAYKYFLVFGLRQDASHKIMIFDLGAKHSLPLLHEVKFPEPNYVAAVDENRDYATKSLRLNYTSLMTPQSWFSYDVSEKKLTLLKEQPVLGGFNHLDYVSERLYAKAADGAEIPISIVYRKGITKDGNNPLFLSSYGSYGFSSSPAFNSNRLSLLDRGFVFAMAHIRGGSEKGELWYEDGKMLKKKNTFTDFIACAEALIQTKYTTPAKLVISGGSAGGLLMGAVLNMRPELFHAVLAYVPFVDVVSTMSDPTLPLTVTEYEEWGNPNEPVYYNYMKSYSPYDNVQAQAYPNLYVTAGINDTRVSYWEPAKWVAKLRDMKTDKNLLLFDIKLDAGHGGSSGRYDRLHDLAREYAFVLDVLGIKQ